MGEVGVSIMCMSDQECMLNFGKKAWIKEAAWKIQSILDNYIKMDVKNIHWKVWNEVTWFRLGIGDGPGEHCHEPYVSMKCGEFLYYMSDC
jgi:hypothetical protein